MNPTHTTAREWVPPWLPPSALCYVEVELLNVLRNKNHTVLASKIAIGTLIHARLRWHYTHTPSWPRTAPPPKMAVGPGAVSGSSRHAPRGRRAAWRRAGRGGRMLRPRGEAAAGGGCGGGGGSSSSRRRSGRRCGAARGPGRAAGARWPRCCWQVGHGGGSARRVGAGPGPAGLRGGSGSIGLLSPRVGAVTVRPEGGLPVLSLPRPGEAWRCLQRSRARAQRRCAVGWLRAGSGAAASSGWDGARPPPAPRTERPFTSRPALRSYFPARALSAAMAGLGLQRFSFLSLIVEITAIT